MRWQFVNQTNEAPSSLLMNGASLARNFRRATSMSIVLRSGQSLVASSSNATAVAIQSANATVLRVTRTEALSISQLYFASMGFSFLSGVRSMCLFSPPFFASAGIYG